MDIDTLTKVEKNLYLSNLKVRMQVSKIKQDMLWKTFMLI